MSKIIPSKEYFENIEFLRPLFLWSKTINSKAKLIYSLCNLMIK